ncbi:hypothetical protein [Virgibacillus pantothenticus]|uniref:hypothetical protein n=1 Tax=Virgibacillus pantothenticus TaxID=1473 RepID=UPI00067E0924|nr:hypothetical protein [Virgibacillus pantothenticus]MED3736787.1 hypothetical protein [Virgibacillus pantothenticus]QTY15203.1 hypothetical protein KBP50_14990 [Virgibacillus pantothenticus]
MASEQTKKPSEMNPEDLPDVRAFQDEFTRGFLQSTEETRSGYYPFLSGTGKYKMDFPQGGMINERGYFADDKEYEEYSVHILSDVVGSADITIFYFSYKTPDKLDMDLESFSTRIGKDINYKKIAGDGQSLYYGNFERNGFHTYAGYIQNEKGDGALEIVYQIDCRQKLKEKCNKNKTKNEKHVLNWMKSISFIDENKEVNK